MPSHVQAAGHSGSAGMMGFNTQSDMIVSLDGRTPFRTIDNPFPDGFNLPPGNSLGASTNLGLGIGGGTGGVLHDQPGAAHAAVERQRPARAAGQHHHGGGLHRQPRHGPPDRRERPGLRPGGSVVPQPRHGAPGPGAEPVLRDHHQPVVAAELPDGLAQPAAAARTRSTTASPRSASRAPSRSTTASRCAPTSASPRASACSPRTRAASSWTTRRRRSASSGRPARSRTPTIGRATTRSRATTSATASSRAFVYDLPFGSDQRFGGGLGGPLGWIASGWQVNGIVTFQSGYPLLMSQGSNNVNLFNPVAAAELDGRRTRR